MTLKFEEAYKTKCYDAFRYCPFINNVMQALNEGNSANLRSYMDASIDDLQNEINQPIGSGEESIHNARVKQLRSMYACWYELFELLEADSYQNYELLPGTSN